MLGCRRVYGAASRPHSRRAVLVLHEPRHGAPVGGVRLDCSAVCLCCCRCDGLQQDGAGRTTRPPRSPPHAPDGEREGEDSDSDIDSMIRRAEVAYGQFRAQFADLLDPSQEEELQQMAALGLPTVLITTRVPEYEWEGSRVACPNERGGMQWAPSDEESDAAVAKAIECDEDIVSVINNLSAVRLGFAAGMPGPWEAVSGERGVPDQGVLGEHCSSGAGEDTMESMLGALQLKAAAFANQEWEAHWSQSGPSLLAQAWMAAYPHLPLSRVESVCGVDFLVAAAAEPPVAECHIAEEGGVSDSELESLWWHLYNQWYWYTYHVYSQSVPSQCGSTHTGEGEREGEGHAVTVVEDHVEAPLTCAPTETLDPMVEVDVMSGSDDGSCEPFSGWENEGDRDSEEVTTVDSNHEVDPMGGQPVSVCMDGGCSSDEDREGAGTQPGQQMGTEEPEEAELVGGPLQGVPHQAVDRVESVDLGSVPARWGCLHGGPVPGAGELKALLVSLQ